MSLLARCSDFFLCGALSLCSVFYIVALEVFVVTALPSTHRTSAGNVTNGPLTPKETFSRCGMTSSGARFLEHTGRILFADVY